MRGMGCLDARIAAITALLDSVVVWNAKLAACTCAANHTKNTTASKNVTRACDSWPCLNGAKCSVVASNNSFVCHCSKASVAAAAKQT